jgi:hypothetical protein
MAARAAWSEDLAMDGALAFEPGMYPETWLVKWNGRPVGAVGYAEGDGRWRAAWRGNLVGESYETREEAAQVLIDRLLQDPDS